ncbi:MAG: hypothetical protein J6S73_08090, partial [Lentisphaeria bacterium]|nr:hypothetical protein [Lentisphaeria bacterium]
VHFPVLLIFVTRIPQCRFRTSETAPSESYTPNIAPVDKITSAKTVFFADIEIFSQFSPADTNIPPVAQLLFQ